MFPKMFRQSSQLIARKLRPQRIHHTPHRWASTLVIGEKSVDTISDQTRAAISAAKQIGGDVTVLVASPDAGSAASAAAQIDGVSAVLCCDNPSYRVGLAENASQLIANIQSSKNFTHIIAGNSTYSRDILPRVAGLLDVSQISDVTKVISESEFERPMYAGNAIAKVRSSAAVKLMTIRPTSFESAPDGGSANVETIDPAADFPGKSHLSDEVSQGTGPSLQSASTVVSGGRGLENGENFKILYELADSIGDAAVGASRAAVDAGYVGNDLQVGQTGKVVAPNLYIAAGISGAIQHLAGMKDSKIIVAINKDEEAPIFSVADFGIVADLFDVVPQLTEKVNASK